MKYTHLLYTLLLCTTFIHASDGGDSEEEENSHDWVNRVCTDTMREVIHLPLPPTELASPVERKKHLIKSLRKMRKSKEMKYWTEVDRQAEWTAFLYNAGFIGGSGLCLFGEYLRSERSDNIGFVCMGLGCIAWISGTVQGFMHQVVSTQGASSRFTQIYKIEEQTEICKQQLYDLEYQEMPYRAQLAPEASEEEESHSDAV